MCVSVCLSVCRSVLYTSSNLSSIPDISRTWPMGGAREKAHMTSTVLFNSIPTCSDHSLTTENMRKLAYFCLHLFLLQPQNVIFVCRYRSRWPMARSSLFLPSCRETYGQISDAQQLPDNRHVQKWTKTCNLGCKKLLPGPAWLLLSKYRSTF